MDRHSEELGEFGNQDPECWCLICHHSAQDLKEVCWIVANAKRDLGLLRL